MSDEIKVKDFIKDVANSSIAFTALLDDGQIVSMYQQDLVVLKDPRSAAIYTQALSQLHNSQKESNNTATYDKADSKRVSEIYSLLSGKYLKSDLSNDELDIFVQLMLDLTDISNRDACAIDITMITAIEQVILNILKDTLDRCSTLPKSSISARSACISYAAHAVKTSRYSLALEQCYRFLGFQTTIDSYCYKKALDDD